MEQFDIEKLKKSLIYVDRIANGKNPINNLAVDDDYILNDPNVIRCMFFIKDVLNTVIENDGKVVAGSSKKSVPKLAFPISKLQGFKGKESMTVTPFVKLLNDGLDKEKIQLIKIKQITDWLKETGYLEMKYSQKLNKEVTISTEKGNAVGISSSLQSGPEGKEYYRVEYNANAQEMIVNNLPVILNLVK